MNMVEKVVEEKDYDIVSEYMRKIDWSGLEQIIEDKYGFFRPVFQYEISNGRYVSISVLSEENLADKCGILSSSFDSVILKDFGANVNRIIRYDDDLVQAYVKAQEYDKANSVPIETVSYYFYLNLHFRYEIKAGSNGLPCTVLEYTENNGWVVK